ncbi:hypothetical protein D3C80_1999170 [compost metagenome]
MRTKANKVADAARGVDSSSMNYFGVELDEQVVRKKGFADRSAFTALDFFKRDHGGQTIDGLTLKMFLRTLELPTFAIQ